VGSALLPGELGGEPERVRGCGVLVAPWRCNQQQRPSRAPPTAAPHQALESGGRGVPPAVLNLVVRTCAAGGRLERALELLGAMADAALKSDTSESSGDEGLGAPPAIEARTFNAVASECLKQGMNAKAEEILEWREYL
jgi:hypothetical protein